MTKHQPHRKAFIHFKVTRRRKYWRWFARLDKILINLELERKEKK
jgi:hypothetical protein